MCAFFVTFVVFVISLLRNYVITLLRYFVKLRKQRKQCFLTAVRRTQPVRGSRGTTSWSFCRWAGCAGQGSSPCRW